MQIHHFSPSTSHGHEEQMEIGFTDHFSPLSNISEFRPLENSKLVLQYNSLRFMLRLVPIQTGPAPFLLQRIPCFIFHFLQQQKATNDDPALLCS
ncbi:hypothetical protein CDAR_561161 [Caerostris darwini]|uniref:Uncharacterized protein n=1 Tax=Caerostris darwini TaxID=1538125 RepID=A0AAV4TEC2_9ARAC|nr:hypothetical protein CDAR_561161 [Caerostris darwini]